jgi:hypothetical protein
MVNPLLAITNQYHTFYKLTRINSAVNINFAYIHIRLFVLPVTIKICAILGIVH